MEQQILHLPVNWIQFWISMFVYLVMGLGAVITVTWKISSKLNSMKADLNKSVSDLKTYHDVDMKSMNDKFEASLSAAIENGNTKRNRIYERFDEHKKTIEELYVRRDMCSTLHTATSQGVTEFKIEMRGQVKTLSDKIDEVKNLIMNQKLGG